MALALLLADTADTAATGGGLGSIAIFVVFGAVMYFMLIRPQQKRQQAQQKLLSTLEVGMDVVTIGGLHGQIVAVDDRTVDLQVDEDGTVLRYERSAVRTIVGADLTVETEDADADE